MVQVWPTSTRVDRCCPCPACYLANLWPTLATESVAKWAKQIVKCFGNACGLFSLTPSASPGAPASELSMHWAFREYHSAHARALEHFNALRCGDCAASTVDARFGTKPTHTSLGRRGCSPPHRLWPGLYLTTMGLPCRIRDDNVRDWAGCARHRPDPTNSSPMSAKFRVDSTGLDSARSSQPR